MRAAFVALLCLTAPGHAEGEPDPLAFLAERDAICAKGPELPECSLAEGRAIALVANAIAEAGQTLDRGRFIDLVRPYLRSEAPELRAAAAYALAKLVPDAADTPVLIGLLRDPVSAVRDGAWAAAGASTDPLARRVATRFPDRVAQNGYWSDPAVPVDHNALGLTLPDGLDYLWLSAPRRALGEAQFLVDGDLAALVAKVVGVTGQDPMTPMEAFERWPAVAGRVLEFQDETIFGAAQVVPVLPPASASPTHFLVVYDDLLFAATGLTVILTEERDLAPVPVPASEPQEAALAPLEDAEAFDAAMMARAGVKPDAAGDETDLYLAIIASGGAAAEDYLEIYPDGTYAAEIQALILAPRLVLDATRYMETGPVMAELVNVPKGSWADLVVVGPEGDLATTRLLEGETGPVAIDIAGRVTPGTYRVRAVVHLPDDDLPLSLWRDFSVELALAELRVAKTEFAPGEMIDVAFLGMSGSGQDYVATVAAGASLTSFLAYSYTGGLREGQLSLPAPTAAGSYELRAFFNEDETVLRASLGFTVTGNAVATTTTTTTTPMPVGPDDSARATLALDGASYAPGATISVTYGGMSGSANDYVSTAAAGAPNSSYLQYAYTNGATEGVATLTAPSEPGAYEVRAFYREDETILRGSIPFVVEGSAPVVSPVAPSIPEDSARAVLELDRASYAPGAPISVTFAGMSGSTSDYVSVAPAGAPNSSYLEYAYTNGAHEGTATLHAPVERGSYEVRAFFREDETILRGSLTFTVE
jgi:hypothetical protein